MYLYVARHSLNRSTWNFLWKFPWGGAPPIPDLSWIHQAILKICAFKVYINFFSPSFATLFEIAITCKCFWRIASKFGAFLEHSRGQLQFNFCSSRINKHWIIIDFLVRSFVTPTGQATSLTNWKSICTGRAFGWLENNWLRNKRHEGKPSLGRWKLCKWFSFLRTKWKKNGSPITELCRWKCVIDML